MTPPPRTVPTETLLEESAWLRRLARRLIRKEQGVRDEAGAEDMVQETLTAALERERGGRVPGRAWLAAVLRNVARLRSRAGARRAAREVYHALASPRAHPATDEVLARLEAQAKLVEAVTALEEPYRSAIALRFLEGLPPREIARRQGVQVKTVRTRIDRGLARLRERLDREVGERGAWCVALAELGRCGPLGAAAFGGTALGGIAMGTAAKWAAAALVVVAAGVAVERSLGGDGEPARPLAHRAVEPREETVLTAGGTLDAPPAADDSGERVAVPSPSEFAPSTSARAELAAPAEATFEGRVVDLAGQPVAGANVVLLDDLEAAPTQARLAGEPGAELASEVDGDRTSVTRRRHAVTDAGGRFDLPVESGRFSRLHARAPGLATVVAPALSWMPPPAMPIVVLGPERQYAGRVVDIDGNGLAGVKLWIRLPKQAASTTDAMAWSAGPFVFASTEEDGTFQLPPAGFVSGMTLVAGSIAGHAPPLALPDANALDLVLTVGTTQDGLLAGRVVDALGVGIADAYVSAGEFRWDSYAITTDGDGAFVLPPASSGADFVRAAAAGRLPAYVSLEGFDRDQRAALVLVLDGTPLSTAGHVLDAAGDPVPGAWVWALDAERFGNAVEVSGAGFMLRETTTERLLSGGGPGAGLAAVADAEGRFELRGLLDREYRVAVMDARTLGTVLDLPLRAGRSDAILRLAPTERIVAVAGRVTNLAGEPLAGANVQSHRTFRGPEGQMTGPAHAPGAMRPSTRTDAEGRFRFDALAVEDVMLHVSAADAGSLPVELANERALEAIEVRVPATCYLRLHPTTGDGDGFSLVDARGDHVPSTVAWGGGTIGGESVRLGMSFDGLVQTDERAAALVLLREGVEVRRIPLAVREGETLDVDL